MLYTLSPALAAIPHLDRFLDQPVRLGVPLGRREGDAMVGWGRKPSYRLAARYAGQRGLPCLSLEDGFIRSVGLGRAVQPLSLVVDDLGIYFDANVPSRLEQLVANGTPGPAMGDRARAIMAAWRQARLSKYNHARDLAAVGEASDPHVLVIDQTFGDDSIGYGMAGVGQFQRMLEAALDEHPGSPVLLKVHPAVLAGRKKGHFDRLTPGQARRVKVLGQDIHAASLLESAKAVYVVTSQMGFEGLLWGKPVRVFGMPFYAGWGLTGDDLAGPGRRRPVALEKLVHAALVEYPRYVDPESGQRCEVERVIDYLALQRRMRQRYPEQVHAIGFGRLRRPVARLYFDGSVVIHHGDGGRVPAGATVAVWGRDAMRTDLPADTRQICLEDGFLRSVGLGAELVPPVSLAMDGQGIYYDATRPSGLETLLLATDFTPQLLARAGRLREQIVAGGLTKYNVGAGRWTRPPGQSRVILVPGQVERDASIRYGSPVIRTNIDFLRAVRRDNPDAYVVYKLHPDVAVGLRRAGYGEATVQGYCDEVIADVPMHALLDQVDELHVLTSLAGFEALLRSKPVTVYGQPFYSGWGLTTDRYPLERRSRKLGIDELVAGALLLYPVYVSRVTGSFTTPEQALDELLAWRAQASSPPRWTMLRQRLLRLALIIYAKLFD